MLKRRFLYPVIVSTLLFACCFICGRVVIADILSESLECDAEPIVLTTEDGVQFVRTPDSCFENLPDFPYEAKYVEIDGLRQAYVDEGPADADPVLLLHGQPSWSYLYRKMIPVLVAGGNRVIAMDHIGMGRSDKPIDIEYYSYLGHIDRLEKFIQALALENITLFCQDWGSLIGLHVAGEHPGWFARIVVGDGNLPVVPAGIQPYPPVENPDELNTEIVSKYASAPPQQPSFYDEDCNLLIPDDPDSFADWMVYAMTAASFHPAEVVEAGTYFDLPAEEEAAYDAPFPSRDYMAGPRVFPSLVNELGGVNFDAWAGLTGYEKPFLTIWASNDPGGLGRCETQDQLINNIPGAAGQPHTRLPEASHFLQDDQGEEIARLMVEFINDTDGDGDPDVDENCPNDPDNDADADGICGDIDNCPNVSNPGQEDMDGDGKGDACEPDPTCVSNKLKAAGKLSNSILKCYSKEIKNSDNFDNDSCIDTAEVKFASSCDKAEAKAAKKGNDCSTGEITAIEGIIFLALEDIYDQISDGIDLEDKDARKLGADLLKAAQKRCANLIKSGADGTFQTRWNKAISKAEKKGVTYTGSSMSEVEAMIDELVTRIEEWSVGGENFNEEPSERVGFEILEFQSINSIRVWITTDMTLEEFDALPIPSVDEIQFPEGWFKNQNRGGGDGPDDARFLRSPGTAVDGEFIVEEHFGHIWAHNAKIIQINIPIDEQGLLTGTMVAKFHEVTFNAGRTIFVLFSPEGDPYVRITRDFNRTSDEPSIPNLWSLVEYTLPEQTVIQLPDETLNIRADNEDSFQGPVPELSVALE